MADCIGTGFPQFPCALVQMRYSIGENGCGHILTGSLLKYRSAKVPKTRTTEKRVRLKKTNCIELYKGHPVRLLDAWSVEE